FMGRSRVAVLSSDLEDRKACTYTGRCLWGCPSGALYTPSVALEECRRYAGFTYLPGHYVTHLLVDATRRVTGVSADLVGGGPRHEVNGDVVVLAAGTLCSTQIYMRSVQQTTGQIPTLRGLMDNRQVLMPFITLRRIGVPYEPASYQYHQLAMGIEGASAADYVHAQITTLKTALAHPIIQNVPSDLRMAIFLFRNVRGGLGLVNVNFADHRRDTNFGTLRPGKGGEPWSLGHRSGARSRRAGPDCAGHPNGAPSAVAPGSRRAAWHEPRPSHGRERPLRRHPPNVDGSRDPHGVSHVRQQLFREPLRGRWQRIPVLSPQEP